MYAKSTYTNINRGAQIGQINCREILFERMKQNEEKERIKKKDICIALKKKKEII